MRNDILVIKSDCDEFEQYYNHGLEKVCHIKTYSEFYESGLNGFARRIQIIRNVKKLGHSGYFNQFEKIIIFDQFELAAAIGLFSGFHGRKILWLWNILNTTQKIKLLFIRKLFEIYTFDENDAAKFNLKINSQMYCLPIDTMTKNINLHNKLFFVGRDKGRGDIIRKVRETCKRNMIPCKLLIVGEEGNNEITQYINYSDVINEIRDSYALLDICREGQSGITVRALEAVFFNKKLVTNNSNIINAKFYNTNNIFILKEDNLDDMISFLNESNPNYDYTIAEYYSLSRWLDRFDDAKW